MGSGEAGLDGTWQLISAVSDGQAAPEDMVRQVRVVIRGGRHTVRIGGEVVAHEIPVAVDTAADPHATTDTLPDGRRIYGIFRLDGDTLTSCVAAPGAARPPAFESRPGSGHTLRVFRRVAE